MTMTKIESRLQRVAATIHRLGGTVSTIDIANECTLELYDVKYYLESRSKGDVPLFVCAARRSNAAGGCVWQLTVAGKELALGLRITTQEKVM